MYQAESMIQMVEDLQRQASEMEKHVKDMMEMEGRAMGIELDKRKNARDLMHQLMEHQESMTEHPPMTWAYVPEESTDYDTMPSEWEPLYEDHPYPPDTGNVHMEPAHDVPADPMPEDDGSTPNPEEETN